MIEMLVVAMILSTVTMRVAGNVAVDGFFAARGQESPRYARAQARAAKSPGAASRYWSQVWEDSWNGALDRHNRRKAGRRPDKPRGAATVFWSGLGQDARRTGRRYWDRGWTRLDERRRYRATRVPGGTDVVPGEVVPDQPVPDPDTSTGTDDSQYRMADLDETGIRTCTGCGRRLSTVSPTCEYCQNQTTQSQDQHHDQQQDEYHDGETSHSADDLLRLDDMHDTTPGQPPTTTPKEHPTMTTTIPTGEVVGLEQAITFFETSAQAYHTMVGSIEQTLAALDGFDVGGPARSEAASAMEQSAAAADSASRVAEELKKHRVVAEAIDTVQGAGQRDFYTSGR